MRRPTEVIKKLELARQEISTIIDDLRSDSILNHLEIKVKCFELKELLLKAELQHHDKLIANLKENMENVS